ncbi:MAG: hypothetical protein PF636_01055 [Actinomycetota bacterium]|jgi:hypothetical protein|nr:hypothetical protein [Actinomycetota bacterium]
MAHIADYALIGPATASHTRIAALIDFGSAMMIAVLAFPFPIVRASFGVAGLMLGMLATVAVMHVVYLEAVVTIWGRTPGMYLMDLGLDPDSIDSTARLRWSFGWALSALPSLAKLSLADPDSGTAAKLSGLPTRSTREPKG